MHRLSSAMRALRSCRFADQLQPGEARVGEFAFAEKAWQHADHFRTACEGRIGEGAHQPVVLVPP